MVTGTAPKTLLDAVRYFADDDVALAFVVNTRDDWRDGPICPRCEGRDNTFLKTRRIWKCKGCAKQFSAKVGTIFEDSPISLSKWLPAMWMLANDKNGISSYELARALGVTQKSAWFMLARIRLAMQSKTFRKFDGTVEVDDTYIGGKARNMHVSKRKRLQLSQRRSMVGKVAVMGLLERHGEGSRVRTVILDGRRKSHFQPQVREHVETDATVNTDAHLSYKGLHRDYVHHVIDHSEAYVDGQIHTNGCENFWSLLKRAIKGTYVSAEPFHLFRHLDEQTFRFNNRKDSDAGRFIFALKSIVNRRVTYAALTGSELPQTC